MNPGPAVEVEEEDELNDETFGDSEEWEWNGEDGDGDARASKDSILRLMSSTIVSSGPHHSNNVINRLPGPNLSSILTCSDLENSMNTLQLDDPAIKSCASEKPNDRSQVADDTSHLDDFDFSDPNDSSSSTKIKSIYFDNVWAPPDPSILKPSVSSNPWSDVASPATPKDDRYMFPSISSDPKIQPDYTPLPTGNVMRLEDIEAGMLNEPSSNETVKVPPVPPGVVKTLEEIERELLEGSSPSKVQQSKSPIDTIVRGPATASQPHTGPYTIIPRPPLQPIPVHPMMHPVIVRPMFSAVASHGVVPMVRQFQPGYIIPPSLYPIPLQRFGHPQVMRHPFMHPQLPPHPYLQHQMNLQRFQGQPMQQNPRFARRDRNEEIDEYAGLMSKKEQEWLVHIQKMQVDNLISDPYVDDYYNMCYNSKKLNNKSTAALLILDRVSRVQGGGNKNNNSDITTQGTTKYAPFNTEGSLGKIQVSNAKCPRKLLDLVALRDVVDSESDSATPALARKELTQLRKLLLDIERLYLILMKIDYEDKRMAALPESSRGPHMVTRKALCTQLFAGVTENKGKKLNQQIASIRKGAALILRTLLILDNLEGKKLIANSLVREVDNFPALLIHKHYLPLLLDAIDEIKKFDPVLAITLKSKIEGEF